MTPKLELELEAEVNCSKPCENFGSECNKKALRLASLEILICLLDLALEQNAVLAASHIGIPSFLNSCSDITLFSAFKPFLLVLAFTSIKRIRMSTVTIPG